MSETSLWENVLTGIIVGVSAGVILAILVEAKRHFDFKMRRRGQIRYIREIVEDFQGQTLSAKAVPVTGDIPNEL